MAQAGAVPPTHATGPSGGTPPQLVVLDEPWNGWNVDGSSDAVPVSGFHVRDYEVATGLRPRLCAFEGCNNRPQVGGHVWLPGKRSGVYIVPICRPCNDPDNEARWTEGRSRIRAGATLMKVAKTAGMRNAVRRGSGTRARQSGAARAPANPPAPAPAPTPVANRARPYHHRRPPNRAQRAASRATRATRAAPPSISVTVTVGA